MFSRSSADRSASFIFLHDEDMEDSGLGESQLHASFDAFGRTVSFSPSEDTADEEERFESLLTVSSFVLVWLVFVCVLCSLFNRLSFLKLPLIPTFL